jgi:hypothetical protein
MFKFSLACATISVIGSSDASTRNVRAKILSVARGLRLGISSTEVLPTV